MNLNERLQLNKLLDKNKVENMTDTIREKKYSVDIRRDVEKMYQLIENNTENKDIENELCNQCFFLFTNYTDIFNKIKKQYLKKEIMMRFIETLEKIENNKLDQHEASYEIGKYLKKIYIDSAIQESELKQDIENVPSNKTSKQSKQPKTISYSEFKKQKNKKNKKEINKINKK